MIMVIIFFVIIVSLIYLTLLISIRKNFKKIKEYEEEVCDNLKWLKEHKLEP